MRKTFTSLQYERIRGARKAEIEKVCKALKIDSHRHIKDVIRDLLVVFQTRFDIELSPTVFEQVCQGHQHFGSRQNYPRFCEVLDKLSAQVPSERQLLSTINRPVFTEDGAIELAGSPVQHAEPPVTSKGLTCVTASPQVLAAVANLRLPGNAHFALAAGIGLLQQRTADRASSPQFTPPGSRVTKIALRNLGQEVELEFTFDAAPGPETHYTVPDLSVFLDLGFTAYELLDATGESICLVLMPPGYFSSAWSVQGVIPCRMQTAFSAVANDGS